MKMDAAGTFQSVECVKIPALGSQSAGILGWEQPESQISLEQFFSQAQLYQSDHHHQADISSETENKSEMSSPVPSCELRALCSRNILSSRRRQAAGETTDPRDLQLNPSLHSGFLTILAHPVRSDLSPPFTNPPCASRSDSREGNASGIGWERDVLCCGRFLSVVSDI